MSLRTARKRAGLTQAQLAEKLGVHQTNIVAWEHGKWFPRMRRAVELAKLLGCTVDEVIAVDSNETEQE